MADYTELELADAIAAKLHLEAGLHLDDADSIHVATYSPSWLDERRVVLLMSDDRRFAIDVWEQLV